MDGGLSGRRKIEPATLALLHLPDGDLFSADEVTLRYFDPKTDEALIVRRSLGRLAERNGIAFSCDNPMRDKEGKPLKEADNTLVPQDGVHRWSGAHWKSFLEARDLKMAWQSIAAFKQANRRKRLRWRPVKKRLMAANPDLVWKSGFSLKRRHRPLVMLLLFSLTTALLTSPRTWPDLYQRLRESRWETALDLYRTAPPALTPYQHIQSAYMEYAQGHLEEAQRLVSPWVNEPSVRARAHYLLACIARDRNEYGRVLGYLELGLAEATAEDDIPMMFLFAVMLAHIHAIEGNFQIAEERLLIAKGLQEDYPTTFNSDYFYAALTRFLILKKDYEAAVCVANERLQTTIEKDKSPQLAYADLAYLHGVLGNDVAYFYNALAAKGESLKNPREDMHYFVRQIAVFKNLAVANPRVEAWAAKVSEWAEAHGNVELQILLARALAPMPAGGKHAEHDCSNNPFIGADGTD